MSWRRLVLLFALTLPAGGARADLVYVLNSGEASISVLDAATRTERNRIPVLPMPAEAIVKGDAKVQAISAASILAKVARDLFCERMHESHPQYGFATHKGYPTPEHLAALRAHGASPWHRRSFAPVREVIR